MSINLCLRGLGRVSSLKICFTPITPVNQASCLISTLLLLSQHCEYQLDLIGKGFDLFLDSFTAECTLGFFDNLLNTSSISLLKPHPKSTNKKTYSKIRLIARYRVVYICTVVQQFARNLKVQNRTIRTLGKLGKSETSTSQPFPRRLLFLWGGSQIGSGRTEHIKILKGL